MWVNSALGHVGLSQDGLGKMWVNSALGHVGLSQVGLCHLGLVLYSLLFSIKDASTILVGMFYSKNVQQKFEGILFGATYIAGLTISSLTGPTS